MWPVLPQMCVVPVCFAPRTAVCKKELGMAGVFPKFIATLGVSQLTGMNHRSQSPFTGTQAEVHPNVTNLPTMTWYSSEEVYRRLGVSCFVYGVRFSAFSGGLSVFF